MSLLHAAVCILHCSLHIHTPMLICVSFVFHRSKELIIKAINDNDFLRNLERVQINEIVECMYQREFTREQYVCREGAVGTELYVISGMSHECLLCGWVYSLALVS